MIFEYFRSPYEITLDQKSARGALDFLVRHDIPFYHLEAHEDLVSFRLYAPYFKEYAAKRAERRFAGETRRRLGFVPYIARYKARAGLLFGGIFAVFLLWFSSLFVWDITVTGNTSIPESVVLDALAENGLSLGAFIPKLDTERMEGILSLSLDGVSFVSINLRGTTASAELREREKNTETVDTESPSNLIAKTDGQIAALEITGGKAEVTLGQIVKKGDILASGIIDSTALGYRLVRARGVVTARTDMTFSVEIPLTVTEKIYTGKTVTKKGIKFFSKTVNFFGNDSFFMSNCDRIEEERRIYLFGKIKLPIFSLQTVYAEYEEITRTITEEEALQKAQASLTEKRSAALSDAEILARHTSVFCDGTTLVLTETVDCIMDIAEEVKLGM